MIFSFLAIAWKSFRSVQQEGVDFVKSGHQFQPSKLAISTDASLLRIPFFLSFIQAGPIPCN